MDLLTILPNFNTKPYTHILPPLERRSITTVDLITLDYLEIAKRAHVPPADVRRLCIDVIRILHSDLGFSNDPSGTISNGHRHNEEDHAIDLSQWNTITTLDPAIDKLLGGGIPTGYLTEVTGESASGKTQFLLNLLLTAQLPSPKGLGRKAIYISTEAPLSTPRLSQILETHPYLSKLPRDQLPSLANVLSITAIDLETQDHILNYQLPVAISRFNVGLVVIDSIAANYRAEHASNSMQSLSARSGELAKLGHMLRNLAVKEDVAIVVANQVSDRFETMIDTYQPYNHQLQQQNQYPQGRFPRNSQSLVRDATKVSIEPGHSTMNVDRDGGMILPLSSALPSSSLPSSSNPSSQLPVEDDAAFDGAYIIGHPVRNETLSLAHQQKFFTGWGDEGLDLQFQSVSEIQKTPALGFLWSTQIACRIVLKKEEDRDREEDEEIVDRGTALVSKQVAQKEDPKTNDVVRTEIKTARDITLHPPSPPSPALPSSRNDHTRDDDTARPEHTLSTKTSPPIPTTSIKKIETQRRSPTQRITRRRIKLVFAPWTSGTIPDDNITTVHNNELEFEIWKGGIRSINRLIDR